MNQSMHRSLQPHSCFLLHQPVMRRVFMPARARKLVNIVVEGRIEEQRYMEDQADFHAFPLHALYPAKQENGMWVRDGLKAITKVDELQDNGFFIARRDDHPMLPRLDGWQDSVAAAGEAAAGHLAVEYLKSRFKAQDVHLLQSTGQLRLPNWMCTLGQVDAGAVADGLALLMSKKTRLRLHDVDALHLTITMIKRCRDRHDSLVEFRGRRLYGAFMADVLPDDEDERMIVLDKVQGYGFGLFVRNGAEFSCSIDTGP